MERVTSGHPTGQLTFILRAGRDCLTTPLNLRCWKNRIDAGCDLCLSPAPTVHHILNNCFVAQGPRSTNLKTRFGVELINIDLRSQSHEKESLYADLPGWLASGSPLATLLLNISSSSDRPDVVISP